MYTLYDIIIIGLFSLQCFYISFFFSHTLEHKYSPRTAILFGWAVLTIATLIAYTRYLNVPLRQSLYAGGGYYYLPYYV